MVLTTDIATDDHKILQKLARFVVYFLHFYFFTVISDQKMNKITLREIYEEYYTYIRSVFCRIDPTCNYSLTF